MSSPPHSSSTMSAAAIAVTGDDTIAAIATASGRGAVALVRVSGPRAFAIANGLGAPADALPRTAVHCVLRDPESGDVLDDVLVTRFVAPHSYTGEDVVEISTHGGRVVPVSVLAACLRAGARQAGPGEFTRRALLNGKLDLLQAEAVQDLVDARTSAMSRVALGQLDGGLSRRLTALRAEIIQLEVLLAYDIDFPEEDDGPIAPARIQNALVAVRESLERLLATAPRAALVRDGALVVIAGPPNAGKSSLFNALLGEARALVTEIPGTTRDAIEALLDVPGMPLRLVDTAGLRATDDVVEKLGIEVSEKYLATAQIVLACAEDVPGLVTTVEAVRRLSRVPIVAVLTKADRRANLLGDLAMASAAVGGALEPTFHIDAATGEPALTWPPSFSATASHATYQRAFVRSESTGDADSLRDHQPNSPSAVIAVSAEHGTGLRALIGDIVARVAAVHAHAGGAGVANASGANAPITRERHRIALEQALEEVREFERAWAEDEVPATIAAVHLRSAVHVLDELVGSVSVDDVLDVLFREFCVGK